MKRTCKMVNGVAVWDPPFTLEENAAAADRLRDMLESGQPPMSMTDREFLQGHCNGSQFASQPYVGDYYAEQALAAGVNPKGKVYLSGLAEFPGDPRAWVDGRGDVKRICEDRGWDCDGAVTVKSEKVDPGKPVAVADDLVNDEVAAILEGVEEPARVDVQDLMEQVIEKRKPHWAK